MFNVTPHNVNTECILRTFSYRNSELRTHYSSHTTLASYSSKGGVQDRVPSAQPVVGWTNTDISNFRHSAYCQHWPPSAPICIWEGMWVEHLLSVVSGLCVVLCTHNSFGDKSFAAAGPPCGTPCHHIWQDMDYI